MSESSSSPGIFGSRLGAATGGLLDPTGFQIVQSDYDSVLHHLLASNGRDALVVWQEPRGSQHAIYARRVLEDGTLLDGPLHGGGIPVATVTPESGLKTLFFDGTNYWLTWFGGRFNAREPSRRASRWANGTADGWQRHHFAAGITFDPSSAISLARKTPRRTITSWKTFQAFSARRNPARRDASALHLAAWYDHTPDRNQTGSRLRRHELRRDPRESGISHHSRVNRSRPPGDFNLLPRALLLCEESSTMPAHMRLLFHGRMPRWCPGTNPSDTSRIAHRHRERALFEALNQQQSRSSLVQITAYVVTYFVLADGPDGFLRSCATTAGASLTISRRSY